MAFEYGEPQTYQVTWKTGKVETFEVHEISFSEKDCGSKSSFGNSNGHLRLFASVDGKWTLLLSVAESEIKDVRLLPPVPTEPIWSIDYTLGVGFYSGVLKRDGKVRMYGPFRKTESSALVALLEIIIDKKTSLK